MTGKPTVLVGSGIGAILSETDAMARLTSVSRDVASSEWADSEVLDAERTAARLSVDVAQLDIWRRACQILVLDDAFPWRQFDRDGPIQGLDQVRSQFDSDETAWEFLISQNPYTGGQPPIEWLRNGHVAEVVNAAAGASDYW